MTAIQDLINLRDQIAATEWTPFVLIPPPVRPARPKDENRATRRAKTHE